jgi:hypothetical protein
MPSQKSQELRTDLVVRLGKVQIELDRPQSTKEMAYWKSVKPLNIGKRGLSRLLLDDRGSGKLGQ